MYVCLSRQWDGCPLLVVEDKYLRAVFKSICSTLDGSEVEGSSFKQGLKELMDICTLCNDSGLAYNEVRTCTCM